ncbi:MAG: hypothetical protein HY961_15455 [Ignavibacteriae bacterium]|nr:hypothetical protein [Ignavibacteriota bacterium]
MKVRKRALLFVLILIHSSLCLSHSQTNPRFNVRLNINYESVEKCIGLYEGLSGNGRDIAALRGSQIAMATTAHLARRMLTTERLEASLDGIKFGQVDADDVFRLKDARQNVGVVKELLTTIRRRNFSQRVASTVEQFFPPDAKIATTIPLYFVAFGPQSIDAYVRRVVWEGDIPIFVGEDEGELTIIVNLAKAVHYGRTADERFIETLCVVAHEVFHAAFGVYKNASPTWSAYFASRESYLDRLLDLTQDEGIAHFLTFQQRSGGYLPPDWGAKIAASFADFNRNATELLSPRTSPSRASMIISSSNTSEYWKSYGAITGMFIARTIDQKLGRAALAETIANGPEDFYRKYIALAEQDNSLPQLSVMIRGHVR